MPFSTPSAAVSTDLSWYLLSLKAQLLIMLSMTGTSGKISTQCSATRQCHSRCSLRATSRHTQKQSQAKSRSMPVTMAANAAENLSNSRRTALVQLLSVPLLASASVLTPQSAQALETPPQVGATSSSSTRINLSCTMWKSKMCSTMCAVDGRTHLNPCFELLMCIKAIHTCLIHSTCLAREKE